MDLEALLTEIFITNGRLLHHERLLCQFPEYLRQQFRFINDLMNSHTVLTASYRYYLAIMAVSCYNCEYLLRILEEQYVLNGGDQSWLSIGLEAVDPKLRLIASLNEMLAHRPWIINASHVEVRDRLISDSI